MNQALSWPRPPLLGLVMSVCLLASLTAGGAVAQAAPEDPIAPAGDTPSDVQLFGLEEVRAGQKGYGLSVFQGRQPQRFEVEVIGVMEDAAGIGDAILAHLSGHGLEESGVLGGMSGSPVYIDGRLAGAVAFSWNFSKGAIAGITPIRDMRRLRIEPEAELEPTPGPTPAPAPNPATGSGTQSATALHAADVDRAAEGRASALPVPTVDDLAHRRFDPQLLQHYLTALRPPNSLAASSMGTTQSGEAATGPSSAPRSTVQWLASGFSDGSRQLLASALGPVSFGPAVRTEAAVGATLPDPPLDAPGSPSEITPERIGLWDRGGDDLVDGLPSARPDLPDLTQLHEADFTDVAQPGAAVMAALVFGDLKLAAAGTVTDVEGRDLVAFGHPFLGAGPVRLPMASADIVTSIPSIFSSFKISNIGRLVGSVWQDRSAGIYGRLGEAPPILPLTVRLHQPALTAPALTDTPSRTPTLEAQNSVAPQETYRMYLAEARDITPALLGTAAVSILDVASPRLGAGSVDLEARFQIHGRDELVVRQSFDAPQAGVQAIITTLSYAAFLMQSPQAPLDLEAVELDFTLHPRRRVLTLVDAHPLRTTVKPGDRLPLFLELDSYTRGRQRRTIELQLPEQLDDGRYVLLIGDGASADAIRLAVAPQAPTDIDDSLALLRGFSSNRELHVLGLVPDRGLVLGGQALPRVPESMQTVWGQAPPGSTQPLNLALVQDERWDWDQPLTGLVRIDLTVRR